MVIEGERLSLSLEHDDGSEEVEVSLPALLAVAERLCDPARSLRRAGPKCRPRRYGG